MGVCQFHGVAMTTRSRSFLAGERLVVVGTLGIELRRLLPGLLHQLAGVLCLLRHNIANGNHLRILGQEPTEQARASSANADEANARILGGRERDIDH